MIEAIYLCLKVLKITRKVRLMKTDKHDVIETIIQQEKIANDFGFCWEDIDQVLDQIKSECNEVKLAWLRGDKENLAEEIGDLINATLSLTIFCDFDPIDLIEKNNKKFQARFNTVVALAKKDGLDTLKGQPLVVLLSYWEKAKQLTGS